MSLRLFNKFWLMFKFCKLVMKSRGFKSTILFLAVLTVRNFFNFEHERGSNTKFWLGAKSWWSTWSSRKNGNKAYFKLSVWRFLYNWLLLNVSKNWERFFLFVVFLALTFFSFAKEFISSMPLYYNQKCRKIEIHFMVVTRAKNKIFA